MADHLILRVLKDENTRLKEENEKIKFEMDRLWKVIRSINKLECDIKFYSSPADIESLIMRILKIALEAVQSENGSVLLLDEDKGELVFVAVLGERQNDLLEYRIPANAGIAGWVQANQEPVLVRDVRTDQRWFPSVDQTIGFNTHCLMAVPLINQNQMIGVLEVVNAHFENQFSENDLELLTLVAQFASLLFTCADDAMEKN